MEPRLERVERCSPEQWKFFFQHDCWRELLDTLQVRLTMTRDELEQPTPMEETFRLRGAIGELRYFLGLEKIIKSEYSDKEKADATE